MNQQIRRRLEALRIHAAHSYSTHAFRRGHARDLASSGARLCEILAAGQWKSPAFMQYLDMNELEAEAVLEAHLGESDDE